MHRENLRSGALMVAAVAAFLVISACSSSVALTSASGSARAADTSVVETSTTELTTTTKIATTAVPTTVVATTVAPTTIPAPATMSATTLPAEPVGDAAPTTVATTPAPTLAPTAPASAPAPTLAPTAPASATTQSGPCPVVNHNPTTTAGCGDATPLVLEVQQMLACVGDPVPEDGVFGPSTYHAVVAYQTFAGLTPDGLAGPRTRAGLSDACFSGDY